MRSTASTLRVLFCALILLGAGGQAVESPNPQVDALRADARMTVLVETALLRDLRFRGQRLGVETLKGVVTLRGKVDSTESKTAAAGIAGSVEGVKSVRDELQVVPPAQRADVDTRDRQIGQALDERLQNDPWLGTEQIGVRVDAGLVTLTGEVRNPGLSARAAVIARSVPGVRDVNNELAYLPRDAVSPAEGRAPRRLRRRL